MPYTFTWNYTKKYIHFLKFFYNVDFLSDFLETNYSMGFI